MRIKICGLCRAADAAAAVAAGADYIGVILAPSRLRSQTLETAAHIFAESGSALRVGVFVNQPPAAVRAAIRALALDVVQLHGQETPEQAEELAGAAEVWKAVAVRAPGDVSAAAHAYRHTVSTLLLEPSHPELSGGTGRALAWSTLRAQRQSLPAQLQLALAGGLTGDNVREAIVALQPDLVDVSSGVEQVPGEKSVRLMHDFVRAARQG